MAVFIFLVGVALGIFSKWLDTLVLDETIWWHRILEITDLGNFFSDLAVWLLFALTIALYSPSKKEAALYVFFFFAGMCIAYHLFSILFGGFNPRSYMMRWYLITLVSPVLAVLCCYVKKEGVLSLILSAGIMGVFLLSCFAVGRFYLDVRGILYTVVFVLAVMLIYQNWKQLLISLAGGLFLALLVCPYWVF
ncbi:MAG: hypothetical protein IKE59_02455 [Erysipelotrichaceae bacterium]|nr:hypothetical protein [Erysipelotrichaceae bacterium]